MIDRKNPVHPRQFYLKICKIYLGGWTGIKGECNGDIAVFNAEGYTFAKFDNVKTERKRKITTKLRCSFCKVEKQSKIRQTRVVCGLCENPVCDELHTSHIVCRYCAT